MMWRGSDGCGGDVENWGVVRGDGVEENCIICMYGLDKNFRRWCHGWIANWQKICMFLLPLMGECLSWKQ